MPVHTKHPDIAKFSAKWERCRDAFDGEDAVKEKREIYLPRHGGQGEHADADTVYSAYLTRASFYNATAPTVVALTGAVFLKPLSKENTPESLEDVFRDVTLNGTSLEGFARDMVGQVVSPGRYGVLVDLPAPVEGVAGPALPYWVSYRAEDIVNWRTRTVAGRQQLVMVVLREQSFEPSIKDPFELEKVTKFRVLWLRDERYEVEIYKKGAGAVDEPEWVLDNAFTPTRRARPLDFIPFTFVGPEGVTADVSDPPLMALVDVNFSHYRTSADKEWAEHWTSIPTPWVSGIPAQTQLHVGATKALIIENPQGQAGYMEFSGAGLGSMRESLTEKRELMATLGGRLLEKTDVPETATAVRLRHSGEHASLTTIADACSLALSKAAQWTSWWLGTEAKPDDTIAIKLNTDFFAVQMSTEELKALMLAWQAGAMSFETFFFNLQRGGLYRPDTTIEDEREKLKAEAEEAAELAAQINPNVDAGGNPIEPEPGEDDTE